MKTMYRLEPPIPIRHELQLSGPFFVPIDNKSYKVAEFAQKAPLPDRCTLFKLAAEDGNLSKAYDKLLKLKKDDDNMDDPKSGEISDPMIVGLEDSSAVEDSDAVDDEFKTKSDTDKE